MMSINELKKGRVIKWNNDPYIIIEYEHARTAQRRAFVRTKLRNIITGGTVEKTFNAADKVEEANLERRNASFLYSDANTYHFTSDDTFEEIDIAKDTIQNIAHFLKEGEKAVILYFNDAPVNIELPQKVRLIVVETEPAVRGDTVSGNVSKLAKLETGYEVQVPMFIKQGEEIIVNTETGKYVERANK